MVWTDPGSLSTASVARTHGGGNIPPPAPGRAPVPTAQPPEQQWAHLATNDPSSRTLSCRSEVIQRLSALGYSAYAPANPLRGVISDGDYASVGAPNVRALVYIAAFAPDEGETLLAAGALDGASNDLPRHLIVRPYPGMPDGDGDAYINPEFFHEQFCADLPDALAAVMAVSQRPVALSCLGVPSGPAGWKTLPSWYMATRAGAHTVEISSSHVAFISHPQETTDLILAAVQGS
jgi:hypothetical protein